MDEPIESASKVASTLQIPTGQYTMAQFNKEFWFNGLQMITVVNPLDYDFPFMVEMRNFFIGAGKHERFPGVIANVYLSQMSGILAQNDDQLGLMSDPQLKKLYYQKLIVDTQEMVHEHSPLPAYLQNVSPTTIPEKAPWEENMERATDVAPQAPTAEPKAPELPKPAKEETKEFEFQGSRYKMVVSKAGKEMYYKDGKMTSSADYFKAASLV